MLRRIIRIDEEACDGCGLCAEACHEGAIGIVDGKAKLLRDDFCDGLGDCLPVCAAGAISFEEREAAAYDEESVTAHRTSTEIDAAEKELLPCGCASTEIDAAEKELLPCGCPSAEIRTLSPAAAGVNACEVVTEPMPKPRSNQLAQWPIQIKLVPAKAPFFEGARLLIAADCCAYAYGDFHERFMKDHTTLIGCPKLDEGDYTEKLTEIIQNSDLRSITVSRMEVPCCAGIVNATKTALLKSGKMVPWRVVTLTADGRVFED